MFSVYQDSIFFLVKSLEYPIMLICGLTLKENNHENTLT